MIDFYSVYYPLCLALSVGLLVKAYFDLRGSSNSFCVGIFLLLSVAILGIYWMSKSVNLEEALLGYKLILLAECVLPPLATFYLIDLCNIKCRKRIVLFAFSLSIVLYGLVIAPNLKGMVFGTINITHDNGLVVISESFGIVHNIIFLLIGIYMLINTIVIFVSLSSKKNISARNTVFAGSCIFAASLIELLFRAFSLPLDFCLMGVLLQVGFLFVITRTRYYSLTETMAKSIISNERIGFVLFDDKRRKLSSNDLADEWFSDIKELRTDSYLTSKQGILNILVNWIDRIDKGEKKITELLESGNNYINVSVEKFSINKNRNGYRVIMRNDTDKQKLITLLSKEKSEALYRSQLITKAIESYMDPGVISQLLKEKEAETTSGLESEVVVMFADIRGFTAFSENKSPEEVLAVLNNIFELMTSCVMQNRGTIDKFIGDCVMAVWQISKEPDAAYLACKTAIDMRDAFRSFNEKHREDYGSDIIVGIGINKGLAVVGNVGTEMRRDYTCIGDTVNLASRLEEMAKGGETYITRSIADEIVHRSEVKLISESEKIRGKLKGIELFELLSVGGRK